MAAPGFPGAGKGWLSFSFGGGPNRGQSFCEVVELAREIGFGDSPRKA